MHLSQLVKVSGAFCTSLITLDMMAVDIGKGVYGRSQEVKIGQSDRVLVGWSLRRSRLRNVAGGWGKVG